MRLLIVAMANSMHTVRWISLISREGWDIYLFPTNSFTLVNLEMPPDVKICSPRLLRFLAKRYRMKKKVVKTARSMLDRNASFFSWGNVLKRLFPENRAKKLRGVIKKIKPDLIHSMHVQEGGYLTLEAKKRYKGTFPKWLVTNWGSELNLFSRISGHREKIMEVLSNCDYLSGECSNDIKIAEKLGFKGGFLPIIPVSGGIDFERINRIKKIRPTSKRKNIMLKGYQNWAGRALVGLRALERCSDVLKGYRIIIYSVNTVDVVIAAELFTQNTGLETVIIPLGGISYDEILSYHGSARISIGLSITDALSTSLLEAMVMGSFPIQSDTSCASEWFKNGQMGTFVKPEDPENVEKAIRKALADDDLVNRAAKLNYDMLFEKLEYSKIKNRVVNIYENLVGKIGQNNKNEES
jgi:glycosyltransferase involved in cell wall biosynthesis